MALAEQACIDLAKSVVAAAVLSASQSLVAAEAPEAAEVRHAATQQLDSDSDWGSDCGDVPQARRSTLRGSAELTTEEAADVMALCGVRTTCGAEDLAVLAAAENATKVGPRPRPTALERLRMAEEAGFTVSEESWPAARRRSMPARIIRQDSGVKITARGRDSVPPSQKRMQRSSLPCGKTPAPRPTAIERLALAQQLGYTVEDQQFAAARKSLVDNNCMEHASVLSGEQLATSADAWVVSVDHAKTKLLTDSFQSFDVKAHVEGVEYSKKDKPQKTLAKRVTSKASKVFNRLSFGGRRASIAK